MSEAINYKGRVWTCDEHHRTIEALFIHTSPKIAKLFVDSVHPKKGNSCKECARSYEETPPCNR
jgi:hypothetical protein